MHVLLMTHTHRKFQECIQPLKLNIWQVTDFEKKLFSLVIISVTKFMLPPLQLVFTASFSAVWTASTGALGIIYLFLIWYAGVQHGPQFSPCHLCSLPYNHISAEDAAKWFRKSILSSCICRNYLHQQDIFAWAPVHSGYPCLTSRYQDIVRMCFQRWVSPSSAASKITD